MSRKGQRTFTVFRGGPLDGHRELIPLTFATGRTWVKHTPSQTDGMLVPHEYQLTDQREKNEHHRGTSQVARFVRTLPEEPKPPPREMTIADYFPPQG